MVLGSRGLGFTSTGFLKGYIRSLDYGSYEKGVEERFGV